MCQKAIFVCLGNGLACYTARLTARLNQTVGSGPLLSEGPQSLDNSVLLPPPRKTFTAMHCNRGQISAIDSARICGDADRTVTGPELFLCIRSV